MTINDLFKCQGNDTPLGISLHYSNINQDHGWTKVLGKKYIASRFGTIYRNYYFKNQCLRFIVFYIVARDIVAKAEKAYCDAFNAASVGAADMTGFYTSDCKYMVHGHPCVVGHASKPSMRTLSGLKSGNPIHGTYKKGYMYYTLHQKKCNADFWKLCFFLGGVYVNEPRVKVRVSELQEGSGLLSISKCP